MLDCPVVGHKKSVLVGTDQRPKSIW